MKWFKVDSNTPRDPKIRGLIQRHGNAGFGALVRLWCFVAEYGSPKRPGWAMDSNGRAIEKSVLVDAAGTDEHSFDILMSEILSSGHASKVAWEKKQSLYFPAMSKRSDVYSRRVVRTKFAHSAHKVSLEENRREEKRRVQVQERKDSGASAPRKKSLPKNGKDPYPVVLKLASDLLGRIPIRKPVDAVSLKEDVKRRCATLSIPYEGNVVGRAVDSALAVRAKVGEKR